jgi:hypothetical protein
VFLRVSESASTRAGGRVVLLALAAIGSQHPFLALAVDVLDALAALPGEALGAGWLVDSEADGSGGDEVGSLVAFGDLLDLADAGLGVEDVVLLTDWVDRLLAGA